MSFQFRILTVLILSIFPLSIFAGRTIALGDATAPPRGEATMTLSYDTDSQDAVGMEIRIGLPSTVKYVAGSAESISPRLDGQSISASQKDNELVIVVYNVSNSPIPAGNGDILKFRLNGGREPGIFTLTPTVKLSDSEGKELPVTVNPGQLTVAAPKAYLTPDAIDFGRVPIRGSYTRDFNIGNSGTTPLHISSISTIGSNDFTFSSENLTIQPGSTGSVTMTYSPLDYADSMTAKIHIESDAVNGNQTLTVTSIPYSVNELHVERAEGIGGEEVTVSVRMNNMEPIVGAEMVFNLPEELRYVDGSVACGERASNLTHKASLDGNKLRLLLFGLGNEPVNGNDGTLLTFRVKLNGQSGWYRLQPEDVKLPNAKGRNMVSEVTGEYVVIKSPAITGASSFDIGNVPSTSASEFVYTVGNNGEAPLIVDRVTFLSEGFEVVSSLPLTVNPSESGNLTLRVLPRNRGSFATTMNIYSNDPQTPMKAVSLEGIAYSPNELTFTGTPNEDYTEYTMTASLTNDAPIVALQLDIVCDPSLTTSQDQLKLSSRAEGHTVGLSELSDGHYRLLIFSLNNDPFKGNEGELFTITFSGRDMVGKKIRIEQVILSNKDGENFTTPGSEFKVGEIEAVEVNQVIITPAAATINIKDTLPLSVTVLPANALDKRLTWESANTAVAEVDETGTVTGISAGETVIYATAASGVRAECKVTVLPPAGINSISEDTVFDVYQMSGILMKKAATANDLKGLLPGIYIIKDGEKTYKVMIK